METTVNIEELKKEIKELETQSNKLNEEIIDRRKAVEGSKEYIQLSKEVQNFEKKSSDYNKKITERKKLIAGDFIVVEPDSHYPRPSYSQTFGRNIHSDVIKAIKKTFDFERLSGSAIESIVSEMISYKQKDDKKLMQLYEEQIKNNLGANRVSNEMNKIMDRSVKDLEDNRNKLFNQIQQKRTLIADAVLTHGEGTREDLKDTGVSFYTKKRSLEEYRMECIQNFKKVFDNMEGKL